ncbi:release factor H-coupled RctB family protein [Roseibium sp. TrichSKD4]|uniref:RNA ligase RtcB family protein n=1 Tax=Roseibium sp. TrichSKD4 TaxID=744980 RepID=UPI0001E5643D|nr:RNA ligase RtcB family protein [Roseibium sp. TrichSKD4]EFO33097.1 release factor H-coupled RctB family protein [Roseibium sp. TrichSKD4]
MGTSHMDGQPGASLPAAVHHFFSQKSWIEGKATDQLSQIATLPEVEAIAAFPDLHPGKFGPVGCAVLSKRLYPHLIGNDIGCGMSLFALRLEARKLRLDKAAEKLRDLEGPWNGDANSRLTEIGLSRSLHPAALGTIGGGNHFCELQVVDDVAENEQTSDLRKGQLVLLVHSGSRSLGPEVFDTVQAYDHGLEQNSALATQYLEQHAQAVVWASLNRRIIAERAAHALKSDIVPIADVPHNLAERYRDCLLHRKGAARADLGLTPLAGSRNTLSYVVRPTGRHPGSLLSLAHGSGRKYDRSSMTGRAGKTKSDREALKRNASGGFIICEDRQLLIEEAPQAYKSSQHVLDELVSFGLVTRVASLKPLLTYKKSSQDIRDRKRHKVRDENRRRRSW